MTTAWGKHDVFRGAHSEGIAGPGGTWSLRYALLCRVSPCPITEVISVEGHFKNVRAIETGEYDFTGPKGERYAYIVVYDDTTKQNLTISLDKDCTPPAVEFGTKVDMWVRVASSDKIVRGEERDRSI